MEKLNIYEIAVPSLARLVPLNCPNTRSLLAEKNEPFNGHVSILFLTTFFCSVFGVGVKTCLLPRIVFM